MSWKTIQSDEVFSSPFVDVHKDKVQLADGMIIDDFYTVTIPDAAAIVALTADNQIILKREYRYSCGEDTIEIPTGTFEKNETNPLIVAKRELLEETGYESNAWTYLGCTRECTAKMTHKMYIFLAKECVKTAEQHLDKTEKVDVLIVPLTQAVDMVIDNRITCNSSARGIFQAARIMGV